MSPAKKVKRIFTPEQKHGILSQIETAVKQGLSVTEAVEKANVAYSNYHKWKKQLAVGVKTSLRNGAKPADQEKRKLARENEKLKSIILSQAQAIADLKKETNWE